MSDKGIGSAAVLRVLELLRDCPDSPWYSGMAEHNLVFETVEAAIAVIMRLEGLQKMIFRHEPGPFPLQV